MNTLSIVIKNLKNFIIKHTVVFIIMFIALIISTITILYVVVKLDCLSDKFSAGDLSLNKIDLKNNECQLAIQTDFRAIMKIIALLIMFVDIWIPMKAIWAFLSQTKKRT